MSKLPSPFQIERAMSAAMQLREQLGDDQEGFALSLESETDAFVILDKIIEAAMVDGVLSEMAATRAKRLKARAERLRDTAARMLDALGITEPIERPAYTASLSYDRHVVISGDVSAEYLNEPTPDKRKIARDLRNGKVVQNATLSNAEPTITIRVR
jgi:hypothetical protein